MARRRTCSSVSRPKLLRRLITLETRPPLSGGRLFFPGRSGGGVDCFRTAFGGFFGGLLASPFACPIVVHCLPSIEAPVSRIVRRFGWILAACLVVAAPARAATLYAVGGNFGPSGGQSALYTMNKANGNATWVGSLGTPFNYDNSLYNGGVAYDPFADRMYALGCDSSGASALFLVDRATAQISRIGYLGGANLGAFCSGGLTFDPFTQKLYAVGDVGSPIQSTALVEVNALTGAATVVGGNGAAGSGTYLSGLGCDTATGVLYANGYTAFDQNSALFTLSKATGLATMVGYHGLTFGRKMNYSGLAIDPATQVMYSTGSESASLNSLYTVSKTSGVATLVASMTPNGIGVDGALVFVGPDVLAAPSVPGASVALRARPSPARGPLSIAFDLPRAGAVTLGIHDVAGRRLATLLAERRAAGPHDVRWDARDQAGGRVPGGVYFATLRLDGRPIGRTTLLIE